jgi:hypothetical protein
LENRGLPWDVRIRKTTKNPQSQEDMVFHALPPGGIACIELAQQLHSVEKAIAQAKKLLIQDHIDHCLQDAVGELAPDKQRTIDEFKEITKYL